MANLWRYDEANDKWIKVSEDAPLPVTLGTEEVDIDIDMATEGLATAANQTNGSQISQVSKLPSSIMISPAITVDTAAYAIGDCMGGKLTLTNAVASSGGTGVLQNITVVDAGAVEPVMDIVIFNADPSAATLTDNAAVDFKTDISKIIDRISIYSTDYSTTGTKKIASKIIGHVVQANGSANLYACLVAEAANDMVGAGDLQVKFGFMRD